MGQLFQQLVGQNTSTLGASSAPALGTASSPTQAQSSGGMSSLMQMLQQIMQMPQFQQQSQQQNQTPQVPTGQPGVVDSLTTAAPSTSMRAQNGIKPITRNTNAFSGGNPFL